jgi:hypothetical protein
VSTEVRVVHTKDVDHVEPRHQVGQLYGSMRARGGVRRDPEGRGVDAVNLGRENDIEVSPHEQVCTVHGQELREEVCIEGRPLCRSGGGIHPDEAEGLSTKLHVDPKNPALRVDHCRGNRKLPNIIYGQRAMEEHSDTSCVASSTTMEAVELGKKPRGTRFCREELARRERGDNLREDEPIQTEGSGSPV